MSHKPRIGMTLDSLETEPYARFPWYGLRKKYCEPIVALGGLPILLIHERELIDTYLSMIDGLVVTGGWYDINPSSYGVKDIHPSVTLNPQRESFEIAITKAALAKNLPFLGICGGEQVLNVALGGSLIQHIPHEFPHSLNHQQPVPHDKTSHRISVEKGTLLHRSVGTCGFEVNSLHHQAVKRLGEGVVVNARAPDGLIEGIEVPAYKFCLGTQWHPEFWVSPEDKALFSAFLEAVRA